MAAPDLRPPGGRQDDRGPRGRPPDRCTAPLQPHAIDLLTEFFPFGTPPFERLLEETRHRIAEEAAGAGVNFVLTGAWAFDDPSVLSIVRRWTEAIEARGASFGFVELRAPLEVRLERNRSELRRSAKKLDWATDDAVAALANAHRWTSDGAFPLPEHHLVIENTDVEAAAAAARIIEHFGLEPVDG